MLPPSRKVERLTVSAYDNPNRSGSGKEFAFFVAPGQLETRHRNRFMRSRGINTSGRMANYAFSFSDELHLELILDNSVILDKLPGLPLDSVDSIKEQVDTFMEQCFYMDGKIHEPSFLTVVWGEISFQSRLKSVEIAYSAFDDQGKPQRAILKSVFIEDLADKKRLGLENKQSPDITHSKMVQQGDTLTGLCKQIYGDGTHYLMVAETNGLNHFRDLSPGMTLVFPPLKESS